MSSRYIIGIDLGTTSCALAYFDTLHPEAGVQRFLIEQWESEGAISKHFLLPSFCYLPAKASYKKQDTFRLPLHPPAGGVSDPSSFVTYVLGNMAKEQASRNPERVIHAAKSWLCHHRVDARAPVLPWHSDTLIGEQRLSPVTVSALLLRHLKDAWNFEMAAAEESYRLEQQRLILTVPASFDELASKLTLEAAEQAGLNPTYVRLLEEPQAAFYRWQASFAGSPQAPEQNQQGRYSVLVCDVGGGTTDFSLLEACAGAVKRVAVSEHILLGGDNIDLALAHSLEVKFKEKLAGKRLPTRQWAGLIGEARKLKEAALSGDFSRERQLTVALAGLGSGLLAATVSVTCTVAQIQDLVLNGFYPLCAPDAEPVGAQTGLVEWGLPYASDTRITCHLAAFLQGRPIDAVLFTGGSLQPAFIQERLLEQLQAWQGYPPRRLENPAMELAVAEGAAWYGVALAFQRGKIQAGYPRTLFVEVALEGVREGGHELGYLCVLPKGFDAAEPLCLDTLPLKVRLGAAVSFRLFSSLAESSVQVGELLPASALEREQLKLVAPVQARFTLPQAGGRKKKEPDTLAISLEVSLGATGLLALACVARQPLQSGTPLAAPQRWNLTFNLQEAGRQIKMPQQAVVQRSLPVTDPEAKIPAAIAKINALYGQAQPQLKFIAKPSLLFRELEAVLGCERHTWELPLLRRLWEPLHAGFNRRGRSPAHECSWLSLAGFVLRPGYGEALDSLRVGDLAQALTQGLSHGQARQVQEQWWIMWRRVAGGLNRTQQNTLYDKIAPALKNNTASPELLMLAGSLELLEMGKKVRLGDLLVKQLGQRRPEHCEQKIWALSRLASRVPLYAGPEAIVSPEIIARWFEALEVCELKNPSFASLRHFYAQAGRMIGDRTLDLEEALRERFVAKLHSLKAAPALIESLAVVSPIDLESQRFLFADSLPAGFVVQV